MPKMTGGIKTGRFYISLPGADAEEVEEYIKESGMYRACFLSYALAVGTRVVERQRTHVEVQQPASPGLGPLGLISVKSDDFSSASQHEKVVARQTLVNSALDQMVPEERTLMELAYFEGLTESELAERLELPLASIKGRMVLALQHLDTLLDENQPADD